MSSIPQFGLPFRVQNGVATQVEQDSSVEIQDCILACLSTRRGSRIDAPDFGVPDLTFSRISSSGPDLDGCLRAVEEGEPRAQVVGESQVEEMVEQIVIRQVSSGV